MGHEATRRPAFSRAFFVFCLSLVLGLVVLPTVARADDYSIDEVDIDATVATDGSVTVEETREFDFSGSYHGVYWKIPEGEYDGAEVVCTIGEVGEIVYGSKVSFQLTEEGDSNYGRNGTYSVEDEGDYLKVKIYSSHVDETADFYITYTDTNLARRYNDTSELYWKFVSDGWDVESQNVTCTVHLPVPSGESVSAGDNVRAWGHGPLDASVEFDGNDVVYTVPGVGTDEYAEARIVFPSSWLSDASVTDENRLDTILSEEEEWADEANARRGRAKALNTACIAVGILAAVGSLFGIISIFRRYKAAHTPQFHDKYYRDVPTSDHPAVLGSLLNGGSPTERDFTASIMRLTDLGVVSLDLVKEKSEGMFGREKVKEDYRLTKVRELEKGEDGASDIDRATLDFLFDRVAPLGKRYVGGEGKRFLYASDISDVAKSHGEWYRDSYEDWESSVEGATISRGFFLDEHSNGRGIVYAMGVLDAVVAFVLVYLCIRGVVGLVGLPVALVLVAVAVLSFLLGRRLDDYSAEAVEVRAKLLALERWLKDFTRLEEAVPTDVVLWDRLLVMAVVLGVSEEVIDQLRISAPEVLSDPRIAPVYGWYYVDPTLGRATNVFASGISSAHAVSNASIASSSMSSGGGFGGGFSGGGGGGFGGGGGGGAF